MRAYFIAALYLLSGLALMEAQARGHFEGAKPLVQTSQKP
jgi:hypothetical protein